MTEPNMDNEPGEPIDDFYVRMDSNRTYCSRLKEDVKENISKCSTGFVLIVVIMDFLL